MIVKDKQTSLGIANEITIKILKFIEEEVRQYKGEDEPAEHVYILAHIIGDTVAKLMIALEGYGKVYAIPNLDIKKIKEWVDILVKEYIKIYTGSEKK